MNKVICEMCESLVPDDLTVGINDHLYCFLCKHYCHDSIEVCEGGEIDYLIQSEAFAKVVPMIKIIRRTWCELGHP